MNTVWLVTETRGGIVEHVSAHSTEAGALHALDQARWDWSCGTIVTKRAHEVAGFDDDSQWGWRVAVTKLDVDESNADYVHEGTP